VREVDLEAFKRPRKLILSEGRILNGEFLSRRRVELSKLPPIP
jgi:hypothetical protein